MRLLQVKSLQATLIAITYRKMLSSLLYLANLSRFIRVVGITRIPSSTSNIRRRRAAKASSG